VRAGQWLGAEELLLKAFRRATSGVRKAMWLMPVTPMSWPRQKRQHGNQHTLADADFRHFFEANELRCLRTDFVLETRDLERYLDLAACEGEERERARALAPGASFPVTVGWYLLRR
jgi:hypothetical protein